MELENVSEPPRQYPVKLVFKKEGEEDVTIEGTKKLRSNWLLFGTFSRIALGIWLALSLFLGLAYFGNCTLAFLIGELGIAATCIYFKRTKVREIRNLLQEGYTLEDPSQMKYLEEQKVVPVEENSGIKGLFRNANKIKLCIWAGMLILGTIILACTGYTLTGRRLFFIFYFIQFIATIILMP